MEFVRVNNIEKRFGANMVLQNVSLALQKGEFGCLLGASGSGKSTLLRIIAGLELPDKGSVILDGKILSDNKIFIKPEKRNIGMIFQDYALFPHLTIRQNIAFGINRNKTSNIDKF